MRVLRGVLIAIVVVGAPAALLLILSRDNPDIVGFLPDDAEAFVLQHGGIGFVVLGVEVVAAIGAAAIGSALRRREDDA